MASYLGWAMNALKSGPNGCLKPGGLHITRNKARQVVFWLFVSKNQDKIHSFIDCNPPTFTMDFMLASCWASP